LRRRVFFYSDPHFGHKNIIKYCNRPYEYVWEHDRDLIKRYNKLVKDNDIVYFLGDIGFTNYIYIQHIIKQLKGRKILIKGNHDRWSDSAYYGMGFDAVLFKADIYIGKTRVHLSHCPRRGFFDILGLFLFYIKKMRSRKRSWKQIYYRLRREWRNYDRPDSHWTVCGHVHEKWKIYKKNINASVDVWDYKPVLADHALDEIRKKEEK
jgi:calcineurin-like phosphoesterase family protein